MPVFADVEFVDKASLPMSDAEILWCPCGGVTCVLFSDGRVAMFTEDAEARYVLTSASVFLGTTDHPAGPASMGECSVERLSGSTGISELVRTQSLLCWPGCTLNNGTLRGTLGDGAVFGGPPAPIALGPVALRCERISGSGPLRRRAESALPAGLRRSQWDWLMCTYCYWEWVLGRVCFRSTSAFRSASMVGTALSDIFESH